MAILWAVAVVAAARTEFAFHPPQIRRIRKSHIIRAGALACVHGYRVLYRTSAQLLADLTASLADKTLPARLPPYASPDLLIINESGGDRIECPEAVLPLAETSHRSESHRQIVSRLAEAAEAEAAKKDST